MKVRSVELCVNPEPKLLMNELHAEHSVVLVITTLLIYDTFEAVQNFEILFYTVTYYRYNNVYVHRRAIY